MMMINTCMSVTKVVNNRDENWPVLRAGLPRLLNFFYSVTLLTLLYERLLKIHLNQLTFFM